MKPIHKLYYNLTITAISVLVAVIIGGVESSALKLQGSFWSPIGALNESFGLLGYGIIGMFALSWVASVVIDKVIL